jgi:hypothetical protein
MLSKLLKYEFKDTARIIPFFYLIIVIFSIMAVTAKQINIQWFIVTSSILLIVMGGSLVIITFVVIVMRFYKNLYSNEGYLMFTLPVKPQQLLASKVIVAFTWIITSFIVFIGALCVSLYSLGVDSSELTIIIDEFKKYGLEKAIFIIIPLILLSILYLLSQIFFSITVANRPALHGMGIGAGFLVFFVSYVILQILHSLATVFVPLSLEINLVGNGSVTLSNKNMFGFLLDSMKGVEPTSMTIGLGGYLFVVIMVCVLFYMTGRMMKNKVSLR